MKLWIWNWIGGGYNSCHADTREQAIEESRRITGVGRTALVIDEETLHVGTYEELRQLDAAYSGD